VKAPSGESKLKVLKAIAQEYNVEWDSSNTEAEFNKKYEDLLVAFANSYLFPAYYTWMHMKGFSC
jgi:vacuolar protein sorting-associated protein IST1